MVLCVVFVVPAYAQINSTDVEQVEVNCSGTAICLDGIVNQVVDGDTIKINNITVRFALASAPELSDVGGIEAKEFIEKLCPVGSNAVVDQDDLQTDGSYGRIVGVVTCNEINLNSVLITSGYGEISTSFCKTSEFSGSLWAKNSCATAATTTSTTTQLESIKNAKHIDGDRVVIDTDKSVYQNTDKILINGTVNNYDPLKILSFIMRSPSGDVIIANEIKVVNGQFTHEVLTGNSMWVINGEYKMHFIYDAEIVIYSVEFNSVEQPSIYNNNNNNNDNNNNDNNNDNNNRPINNRSTGDRIYITMNTDKDNYNTGDTITLSGEVLHYHTGTPVTFIVISPTNNIVYIDQVDVSRKKVFSTTFIADGNIKVPGEYTIDARYGDGFIGLTTFNFEKPEPIPIIQPVTKPVFLINGYMFDYFMSDGEVTGITADTENNMLSVIIKADDNGHLILSVPTAIAEGDFIVVINDKPVEFTELETTDESRTIMIPYSYGDNEISIFASSVVPEFGNVVFFILIVGIIPIIGLAYNKRLNF